MSFMTSIPKNDITEINTVDALKIGNMKQLFTKNRHSKNLVNISFIIQMN